MSRPKAPADMKRPNRRYGDVLRELLVSPLCRFYGLRVVAYRRHTIRIECECGLRFPLDVESMDASLTELDRMGSPTSAFAYAIYSRHRTE